MKIELIIEGEDKTFSSPFISGRVLKTTMSLANQTKAVDETFIDEMADYIVMVYGKQFTSDQLLDGISSDALIPKFQEIIQSVTGQLGVKLVPLQDPNA